MYIPCISKKLSFTSECFPYMSLLAIVRNKYVKEKVFYYHWTEEKA